MSSPKINQVSTFVFTEPKCAQYNNYTSRGHTEVLAGPVATGVVTVEVNEPDVKMVGAGFATGVGVTATSDRLRREEEVERPINDEQGPSNHN